VQLRAQRESPACAHVSSDWCLRPGIVLTNDGNAILREIDVSHPAAKVCRSQLPLSPVSAPRARSPGHAQPPRTEC